MVDNKIVPMQPVQHQAMAWTNADLRLLNP